MSWSEKCLRRPNLRVTNSNFWKLLVVDVWKKIQEKWKWLNGNDNLKKGTNKEAEEVKDHWTELSFPENWDLVDIKAKVGNKKVTQIYFF